MTLNDGKCLSGEKVDQSMHTSLAWNGGDHTGGRFEHTDRSGGRGAADAHPRPSFLLPLHDCRTTVGVRAVLIECKTDEVRNCRGELQGADHSLLRKLGELPARRCIEHGHCAVGCCESGELARGMDGVARIGQRVPGRGPLVCRQLDRVQPERVAETSRRFGPENRGILVFALDLRGLPEQSEDDRPVPDLTRGAHGAGLAEERVVQAGSGQVSLSGRRDLGNLRGLLGGKGPVLLSQSPDQPRPGADHAKHKRRGDEGARDHTRSVALHELSQAVDRAGRAGGHGFIVEVAADVRGKPVGGFVPA